MNVVASDESALAELPKLFRDYCRHLDALDADEPLIDEIAREVAGAEPPPYVRLVVGGEHDGDQYGWPISIERSNEVDGSWPVRDQIVIVDAAPGVDPNGLALRLIDNRARLVIVVYGPRDQRRAWRLQPDMALDWIDPAAVERRVAKYQRSVEVTA